MFVTSLDPPQVPPLLVQFINNSPRLTNNSVEVDIALSRHVPSLVCVLKGQSTSTVVNCEYYTTACLKLVHMMQALIASCRIMLHFIVHVHNIIKATRRNM